ncbi:helix-turn-helix transcriptional regulator [Nocardia sp. NPDC050793]|uniref:helix-turn-helix domain-containing protein n=1 Tax=Nocardia sp. NPDC050793 TaxID=3155159 RepID=UPI003407997D
MPSRDTTFPGCPIPASVPPGFWDSPTIRSALESRHMGKVVAAYRTHRAHPAPISQTRLASWLGITQGQLSRIENGPPVAHLDKLIEWARVLAIPAALLWFRLPGPQPRTPPSTPPSTPAPGPFRLVRVADLDGDEDPDIAAMHTFRSADRSFGGGHLYSAVLNYLHTDIGPRMFGGPHRGDAHSLFTAAAGLTEMAGWMSHDAGHDQQADRHFRRALDLAVAGRDHQLHVHVLASLSHLELSRETPDPREALRHAHDADMALNRIERHPELVARIYALQARAHATLKQPQQAHRSLEHAAAALSVHADPITSPWVSHFDEASLASDAARCLRTLDDLPAAARHAHRIIDLRPAGTRSRAFAQVTLGVILANQGHPDHACAVATAVLNDTVTMNSHLLTCQLHDLVRQLQRYRTTTVRQFVDHLNTVIHERTSMHRSATNS